MVGDKTGYKYKTDYLNIYTSLLSHSHIFSYSLFSYKNKKNDLKIFEMKYFNYPT